jgi:hypothetical protein
MGEVEVHFYASYSSVPDGGEWSVLLPNPIKELKGILG